MTTKTTYYSDCRNQRSLTSPLLDNGVEMKTKGFFDILQDSNSFNSVGFGLKKSRYGKSLIYCDDSSKLFSIEQGYVGIVLKLPDKIVNGVYVPLLKNDTVFNEHLIWGVNVGKTDVSLPSIYAKFTTTAIDFTIWASNGKFSMKDIWSNVDANTDIFMEFIWSNSAIDDFGISGFDARMVFRLNGEAVVIANAPLREQDSNSIENLNFCLLDTPYIYSNMECTIKKIMIADGLPQFIEEDLKSTSSSSVSSSSSSEEYSSSSSSSSEEYSSSSSSSLYAKDMALGDYFSLGLNSSLKAKSWGLNSSGQLGTNNVAGFSSPVVVIGNHQFYQLSAGSDYSVSLKQNGEVWSWGNNTYGQLGDGTVNNRSSPISIVGNHSFIKVCCAGLNFSAGLKDNGEIWTWGRNHVGQLGTGDKINYSSPVLVVGNHSFVDFGARGLYCAALKSNGEIWTWGYNANGQLGTGDTTGYSSPMSVIGNHSFIEIYVGNVAVIGKKSNGELWAWGWNYYGELGDGTTDDKSSPILVIGNHSFEKISFGQEYILALKSDKSLWGWGKNDYGQLGDNTVNNKSSPTSVANFSFTSIKAGSNHSAGIHSNGQLWTWGNNSNGQLGDNTNINKSSPIISWFL
jgi:alpha-tubulin suppressor-like RCC1 family protein